MLDLFKWANKKKLPFSKACYLNFSKVWKVRSLEIWIKNIYGVKKIRNKSKTRVCGIKDGESREHCVFSRMVI